MSKPLQIILNLALYSFLIYLLYRWTIVIWAPWDSFVVAFVLILAIVIWFVPQVHADGVHPGEYPYED
ncbi:MAG: hypothetical protein HQK55_06935 [Deltaproteobacteria bacterium]|nr:hypothetical protein [Deltaproteobacteria bacterium]